MSRIRRKLNALYEHYRNQSKVVRFIHMDEVMAILEALRDALDEDEKDNALQEEADKQ